MSVAHKQSCTIVATTAYLWSAIINIWDIVDRPYWNGQWMEGGLHFACGTLDRDWRRAWIVRGSCETGEVSLERGE